VDNKSKIAEVRMPFGCKSKRSWISYCEFLELMPEDIVTAPSVNVFKGRFDKKYAYLQYCTDIDYVTV